MSLRVRNRDAVDQPAGAVAVPVAPLSPPDLPLVAKCPGGMSERIEVDGVLRPTANSTGRPIAQTEGAIRNFWRWFGDSETVDEQGRPLVMYHGTNRAGFAIFDPGCIGINRDQGWYGTGFYCTPDPRQAASYGSSEDSVRRGVVDQGASVMPIYVQMRNPQVTDIAGRMASPDQDGTLFFDRICYDHRGYRIGVPSEVMVRRSEQIKSATANSGAFDPWDPDIRA